MSPHSPASRRLPAPGPPPDRAPARPAPGERTVLDIVVPVHDEEADLEGSVRRLHEQERDELGSPAH